MSVSEGAVAESETEVATVLTGTTRASVKYSFLLERPVVEKLNCEILSVNDSQYPSYTKLEIPYRVICRQRYHKAGTKQRLQFIKEIRKQEISQSKALSGVRIHREFLKPVLTPPSKSEIIKLTPKQQFKLTELMNS